MKESLIVEAQHGHSDEKECSFTEKVVQRNTMNLSSTLDKIILQDVAMRVCVPRLQP